MTTANPSQTLLHLQQQKQALLAQGRNDFTLRMHRALSWLGRAETLADEDEDLAFISLWIAFNAAYAQEKPGYAEKEVFREFFQLVSRLDTEKTIYKLIWNEFSGPIRSLLDNRYVFQPFWEAHNSGKPDGWQQDFEQARKKAHRALAAQDTDEVLWVLFQRLYTLRNQLVHGGATWNSSVNRAQVRSGRLLLSRLLPAMLEVMMKHPAEFAAAPFYPVVSD